MEGRGEGAEYYQGERLQKIDNVNTVLINYLGNG